MATSRLSLGPLNPAGGIEVVGEAETLAVEGGRLAPEHERVFLDPDMLPLSGRHILRLSALPRGGGHGA